MDRTDEVVKRILFKIFDDFSTVSEKEIHLKAQAQCESFAVKLLFQRHKFFHIFIQPSGDHAPGAGIDGIIIRDHPVIRHAELPQSGGFSCAAHELNGGCAVTHVAVIVKRNI